MKIKILDNPICQCGFQLNNHLGNLRCPLNKNEFFLYPVKKLKSFYKELDICGSKVAIIKVDSDEFLGYQCGELYEDGGFLPYPKDPWFCPNFNRQWYIFER